VSKEFNQPKIGLVKYKDLKGEKRPEYLMTKDGFTLLAMGFTGSKAMAFEIELFCIFCICPVIVNAAQKPHYNGLFSRFLRFLYRFRIIICLNLLFKSHF